MPMDALHSSVAALNEIDVLDAQRELVRNASAELSPSQLASTGPLTDYLSRGTRVYIPSIPGAAWGESMAACRRLSAEGMRPVPHLPARLLRSAGELDDRLGELAAAGVGDLLLVAGDHKHAAGPYHDTLEMWREEREMPGWDPSKPILRALAKDGGGNVLHSEKGEVFCRCPATGTERPMAFQGFEKDRGTLKYRCPAAAYGLECAGRERCLRDAGAKAGDYGRVVRIPLKDHDRRMFAPTPWGGRSWRRGYNRRGALERINSRLDNSFGFENHFIRGKAKMKARMGLALCVMMALALGAVMAGRPERMRSLVDPGLPLAA